MSTTTNSSVSSTSAPAPTRRRAATPMSTEAVRSRRSKLPPLALALLMLIAGIAIGAFVMRQRYRAKDIVVAINGAVITKDDFFHRLEMANGPAVLHQMVGEELQLQFAQKMGLMPTDSEVDARLDLMRKQSQLPRQVSDSYLEDIKHSIRVQLASAAVIGKGQQVTDAEMQAFYNAQTNRNNPQAQFYTPPTATISVIVTAKEADAQKALQDLNNGSPFAIVAKKWSQDGSKVNGGQLPPIARGRTKIHQVPGMEDAIFGLPVGGQTGPRRFLGVWWIIRCQDKTAEVTQSYDSVKDECRTGVLLKKGGAANARKTETDFVAFQKSANVQAFWKQYSQAVAVK